MTLPALATTTLLAITLSYVMLCWLSPFGACGACDGLGFHLTHNRRGRPRRGKTCRRCKGRGLRIRRGRHWYNLARSTHRAGTQYDRQSRTARQGGAR
ncbi:hypothetical protein AB0M28_33755 [Streptomyces sp. NPDC051940]|uniref:hypothetical protein n=1 Tax=Streptomyces sp. NPDC051940 TaxID=3155675 RepID=UPI0034463563